MDVSEIRKAMPDWSILGVLGRGAFGTVFLVQNETDSKIYKALKVIKIPPSDEAVIRAEQNGIDVSLLKPYFNKFRNELIWELRMFKSMASEHLAGVDSLSIVDDRGKTGWTA